MRQTFISKSENETMQIAEKFSKKLKGGEVIALNGELGAGKTIFAKGLAKGLNVKELVTSPTFTLLNSYKGKLELHHFDMYRIDEISEVLETGIYEYLQSKGVCVIEWSEKIKELLPKNLIKIDILKIDDTIREITIDEYIGN